MSKNNMVEQERLEKAQELGKTAFEQGIKSAPCLDKRMMQMIAETSTGVGSSKGILQAWLKGWHKANMAKSW